MELTIRFQKETLKGLLIGVVLSSAVWGPALYLIKNDAPKTRTIAVQNQPSTPADAAPSKAEFTISENDHLLGKIDAPVVLVEFADFQCPYCSRHHQTMEQVRQAYGDKVAWVWKHYPLSFHQYAAAASEASECAAEQGKFWEYADKLMANQKNFSESPWLKLAQELNLNQKQFSACFESGKYKEKVAADLAEGGAKGVEGTPATFVNGELISGAVPFEQLKQTIDKILTSN
ncbi:MAG: DsbA family protein [Candidatus Magasanikbacteria bacterium]|nr:DsbA family protein [Candidatus Magasanikbacteria bacterium]